MMEEKLLEGLFYLFPSCKAKYEVIVTRQNIMYREMNLKPTAAPKHFTSLLMENVIGCHIYESKFKKDQYCCFTISTLMKNKKGQRERKKITFCIFQSDDKQENMTIAETWARTLSWLALDPNISVRELEELEAFPPQRRFYVMINPKSGKGKSIELFKAVIEPIFLDAMIKYDVLVTEYGGHVSKIAKDFDYKKYDGVIICSGDGLAYEYINGIMQRPDYKEALATPVGILPTGSGNALAASINYAAKEEFGLVNAVYVLLKGQSHPMDLFSCTTLKDTVYGFLSVTWGLIADVDIESEKFRVLGALRFTIGGLQRILSLRHYRGTLYYLPVSTNEGSENEVAEDQNPQKDNETTDTAIRDEKTPSNVANGSESNVENGSESNVENGSDIEMSHVNKGPELTLPPLGEPVSDTWCKVDDEFILIGMQSISHLGSGMHSGPGIFFNDGILDLQYVTRGTSKKTMLDLMEAFETGVHVDFPDVKRVQVKAYRLVPGGERPGHIAVDGEEVEYGSVQGEILPSLANVIMLLK